MVVMRRGKPRASGDDPRPIPQQPGRSQVNPARAGMIPPSATRDGTRKCKPRASGDDPEIGHVGGTDDP